MYNSVKIILEVFRICLNSCEYIQSTINYCLDNVLLNVYKFHISLSVNQL